MHIVNVSFNWSCCATGSCRRSTARRSARARRPGATTARSSGSTPSSVVQAVSTIEGYELLVSGDYVASNIPLSPTHIVTHGLVPISPEARQEVEAWMDTWPTPTEGRTRRATAAAVTDVD